MGGSVNELKGLVGEVESVKMCGGRKRGGGGVNPVKQRVSLGVWELIMIVRVWKS